MKKNSFPFLLTMVKLSDAVSITPEMNFLMVSGMISKNKVGRHTSEFQ